MSLSFILTIIIFREAGLGSLNCIISDSSSLEIIRVISYQWLLQSSLIIFLIKTCLVAKLRQFVSVILI